LERFGSKSAGEIFSHAIDVAEYGSPVTHKNAEFIGNNLHRIQPHALAAETFMPGGNAPRPHGLIHQPRLARTYRTLSEEGPDAIYRGALGEEMCRAVQGAGGYLSKDDLASLTVDWLDPIQAPFHDFQIFGAPPPTCTIEYLELLRILESEDLRKLGHNSADYLHLLIEAIKLTSADRIEYTMRGEFDVSGLLTDDYVATQRTRIDRQSAAMGRGERYGSVDSGAISPGRTRWPQRRTYHALRCR
ncbi:MAG: gamma-glutamyltransferase, partial [Actinomycetota bacterium]